MSRSEIRLRKFKRSCKVVKRREKNLCSERPVLKVRKREGWMR